MHLQSSKQTRQSRRKTHERIRRAQRSHAILRMVQPMQKTAFRALGARLGVLPMVRRKDRSHSPGTVSARKKRAGSGNTLKLLATRWKAEPQGRKRGKNANISMVEKTEEKSAEKVSFSFWEILVAKRIKRLV